jgi:Tfp pilus assembly protein PilE
MTSETKGVSVAVVTVGLAVLASAGYQTWLLAGERTALDAAHAGQQKAVEEAARIEKQLENLAGATATMAQQGNANAQAIVRQFAAQGVQFKPTPPAAQQPAP